MEKCEARGKTTKFNQGCENEKVDGFRFCAYHLKKAQEYENRRNHEERTKR